MRLSTFILTNLEPILSEWEKFAATVPATEGMDSRALRDDAERMLVVIARDLETSQSPKQQERKGKGQAPPAVGDTAAEVHGACRFTEGFNLDQMVSEYRALRASVVRLWAPSSADPDALVDLTRFNEAIDQALTESIEIYAKNLDRSRELFMGVLGHDLRSPIGAIMMSAQFLLQTLELAPGAEVKSISRILSSAKHIKAMVLDLLDVTRTRLGGSLPLECIPMNLADTCQAAIDEARAFHPDSTFELHLTGDLCGTWDKNRMGQVLSNLMENAIRYAPTGTPVTLSAIDEEMQVVLMVHNSGKPIPESAQRRIFEPLVREERGDSTQGGLGLGLYIANLIANGHGGSINVDSNEARGTTFTVWLPRDALPTAGTLAVN